MNPETTATNPSAGVPSAPEEKGVRRILITPPPYEIEVPVPDLDKIVIEDNTPLDNIFMEKQERLLTEPLYSNWPGPGEGRPFQVFANVGLFHTEGQEGLAPDIMLAIDARTGDDMTQKRNRSYFVWIIGKPPDVVIEMVSDGRGREEDFKLAEYARIGVPYYVIFDPFDRLHHGVLRCFERRGVDYHLLPEASFPRIGLGLLLWPGTFEDREAVWLRWRDSQGQTIPTGHESAEQQQQRTQQAEERAEQERQRAEQERQRAEQERQRAEQERQRTNEEREKRERLEAQLRALGIEPNS